MNYIKLTRVVLVFFGGKGGPSEKEHSRGPSTTSSRPKTPLTTSLSYVTPSPSTMFGSLTFCARQASTSRSGTPLMSPRPSLSFRPARLPVNTMILFVMMTQLMIL